MKMLPNLYYRTERNNYDLLELLSILYIIIMLSTNIHTHVDVIYVTIIVRISSQYN